MSFIKELEAIFAPRGPAVQMERGLRGLEWASSPRQETIKVLAPKANANSATGSKSMAINELDRNFSRSCLFLTSVKRGSSQESWV